MNWRTEDAIFERFMVGESSAEIVTKDYPPPADEQQRWYWILRTEQAIRNAIKRRERKQTSEPQYERSAERVAEWPPWKRNITIAAKKGGKR